MGAVDNGHRLEGGGTIDRSRPVTFRFNGRRLRGFRGDTLASALIANGVRIIGRSLKYHRPRGFFGAGVEDPGAMLAVRDAYGYDPALRAGEVRLVEGLEASTLSGWPSAQFDVGAIAQLASPMLAAGFYYKTFMWPRWQLFEPMIRACTGFGRPDPGTQRRSRAHRHDTCDVLIVGTGPAGLGAARALAGRGLRVIVAEREPVAGGCLRWEDGEIDGVAGSLWAETAIARFGDDPAIEILANTVVAGAYPNNLFVLVQSFQDEHGIAGQCLWKLRARHVVIATGTLDRPLVFQNNDRPGIMLAAAVRRFINEYAAAPCGRLAVYTNNDSAYLTAFAALRAGLDVPVIVDTRPRAQAIHGAAAIGLGIACEFEAQIVDTRGYKGITGITVGRRSGGGTRHACTGLAVSGGCSPLVHLAAHVGARLRFDSERGMLLCDQPPGGWLLAGGAAGIVEPSAAIDSGTMAADTILRDAGHVPSAREMHLTASPDHISTTRNWTATRGNPRKMWVDLQNDVKVSDIDIAVQENYASAEHLKRYTTLGMGTDQGRTSNINGMAILAGMTGRDIEAVGTTTFRPPYTAIRMDAFAHHRQGDLYRPRRVTPIHEVHKSHAAVFHDFGWERPVWYETNGGERETAVRAEMDAVRHAVGVFDASPLGKLEVVGPDATAFLNRFYISDLNTLKAGRIRYSVMLREDGTLLDDGVVTCIDERLYLVGTTSANAHTVAAWLERWHQTEWPGMRIAIVPVTSDWATVAIAGPRAREILNRCEPDFDTSAESLRHMAFRQGHIGGVPARVARVSYTGELQYEISVAARHGAALFRHMLSDGADLGARAVGMEAWLRLRLEKGYVHLGSDTNAQTIPDDIGMGKIARRKSGDFIGKRSLTLTEALREDREQFVGLRSSGGILEAGGRVLRGNVERPPCATEGYVTSACYSPTLGTSIGLGLIERGRERHGESVRIYASGEIVEATIGPPIFYDPDYSRLRT